MGKPTGKKKSPTAASTPKAAAATVTLSSPRVLKHQKSSVAAAVSSPRGAKQQKAAAAFDEDTAIFITMSQELKEEGNKLFQKRDHEGAMLKYEKALNLLPKSHIDVAYLRTNMATCYMQLGLGEYPRAINECNLALEVSPKYTKALLKRARCYEALNRLDLAFRDVSFVLRIEPNNLTGLELLESVKKSMSAKGIVFDETLLASAEEAAANIGGAARLRKVVKEKVSKKKKKGDRGEAKEKEKEKKVVIDSLGKKLSDDGDVVKDKEVVLKNVEEEKKVVSSRDVVKEQEFVTRSVKLVLGEDIRWAQLPAKCSIGLLRDVVRDRFPGLKGVLVKYKDPEGDLVTITTTEELRLAEISSSTQGSLRFYVVEVELDQEPAYEGVKVVVEQVHEVHEKVRNDVENENAEKVVEVEIRSTSVDDWIVQFARLFKNHVGFDSDSYLDIHELGMKLYSEAMEDVVTSEEAQELFDIAVDKFQDMTALALFNWGNVHMSKARKQVFFTEDGSKESVLAQVKAAYEWAKKEYIKAGARYQEALRIKPDFYDGLLALGQQQFEQAKLCWYHGLASKIDLENGPSEEILDLYNKAEDCMERGMQMWEESEEHRLNGLSKFDKYKEQLQKMGLDGFLKDQSAEEAAELAANMSAQIYLLWGTMLYERSVVEYKLELPTWEECLEVSVEKFELAGASPTDVAVMIKNHCSNETALEGKVKQPALEFLSHLFQMSCHILLLKYF